MEASFRFPGGWESNPDIDRLDKTKSRHPCVMVVRRVAEPDVIIDMITFDSSSAPTFSFYRPWTPYKVVQDAPCDSTWGTTIFCGSNKAPVVSGHSGNNETEGSRNLTLELGSDIYHTSSNKKKKDVHIVMDQNFCHILLLDAYLAQSVMRTSCTSPSFQKSLYRYALSIMSNDIPASNDSKERHGKSVRTEALIVLSIHDPKKDWLDLKWSVYIGQLIAKKGVHEDAMSWLNTLGGGFSALGDHFVHHAEEAGKISLRQMKVALEMGDPPTIVRCYLYLGLSLMQRGYLHRAKLIIRAQYEEALMLPVTDMRLLASCKGVWSRLQYLYSLRRHTREQPIRLPGVCLSC